MATAEIDLKINTEEAKKAADKFRKDTASSLKGLQKDFKNFGKTRVQLAKETSKKRLKVIDNALKQQLISTKEAAVLRGKIEKKLQEDIRGQRKKSFTALKVLGAAAVAAFAGAKLFSGIKNITAAAIEQENAVNQLNTSLKLAGDFSEEASKGFQDFATELQRNSTIGDEVILNQIAIAKSFGTTNEQAKELVAGAADLAQATGISLDSAVRNLGKTFGGLTGELGEVVPELKNFTQEQLKSGAALKFITQRFGGAAQAATKTFGGAIEQASNTFGDFQEVLGSLITDNPLVIAAINQVSLGFSKLGKFINENKDTIIEFVNKGFLFILKTIPPVLKGIRFLVNVFGSIQVTTLKVITALLSFQQTMIRAALSFKPIQIVINTTADLFRAFVAGITKALAKLIDFGSKVPGISNTFKKLDVDLKSLEQSTLDVSKSFEKSIGKDVTDSIKKVSKGIEDTAIAISVGAGKVLEFEKSAIDTAINFSENLVKSVEGASKRTSKSVKKTTSIVKKEAKKQTQAISAEAKKARDEAKNSLQSLEKELVNVGKTEVEIAIDAASARSEIVAKSLKERLISEEKAAKLIVGIQSKLQEDISAVQVKEEKKRQSGKKKAVGEAVQDVSAIFNAISSGFDFVKDFGLALRNAALDFFSGDFLIQLTTGTEFANLPGKLQNTFDDFNDKLDLQIAEFPKQAQQFVSNFPALVDEITSKFENLLLGDFLSEFPRIADTIVDAIPQIAEAISKTIVGFAKILGDAIPEFARVLSEEFIPAITKALPEVSKGLAKAAPALTKAIVKALPGIIDALPSILEPLIKAIPKVLNELLLGLPDIIISIANALPEIFKQLVDIIPEVVTAFAENADEIVLALVEGLIASAGDIIVALVDSLLVEGGLERIVGALVRAMPRVAIALTQGMIRGMASAGEALFLGFRNAFEIGAVNIGNSLFNAFKEAFNAEGLEFASLEEIQQKFQATVDQLTTTPPWLESFEEAVDKLAKGPANIADIAGGGGGGGPLGGITSAARSITSGFGFAEGGQVPPGFPNDSFPARLTSGEAIIPPGDTRRLSAFLDAFEGSGGAAPSGEAAAGESELTVNVNVSEQQLAQAILNLNRNGFRVA